MGVAANPSLPRNTKISVTESLFLLPDTYIRYIPLEHVIAYWETYCKNNIRRATASFSLGSSIARSCRWISSQVGSCGWVAISTCGTGIISDNWLIKPFTPVGFWGPGCHSSIFSHHQLQLPTLCLGNLPSKFHRTTFGTYSQNGALEVSEPAALEPEVHRLNFKCKCKWFLMARLTLLVIYCMSPFEKANE